MYKYPNNILVSEEMLLFPSYIITQRPQHVLFLFVLFLLFYKAVNFQVKALTYASSQVSFQSFLSSVSAHILLFTFHFLSTKIDCKLQLHCFQFDCQQSILFFYYRPLFFYFILILYQTFFFFNIEG